MTDRSAGREPARHGGSGGAGEVFADLGRPRRVWAVGAVHGEAARLRALHDELADRMAPGDRLVYLGNYLGIGPDVAGTLDELVAFRRAALCLPGMEPQDIVYLRGAQEEIWRKLQQLQFATGPGQVLDWMLAQGAEATLKAYGGDTARGRSACREGPLALTRWTGALRASLRSHPGHDELLASLRRAAFTADRALLLVHAGIDPARPLDAQKDTFWWGSGAFESLAEPYQSFRLVVRGFDRRREPPRVGPHIASIDAGCGFGGPLQAVCFGSDGAALDRLAA